MRPPVLSPQSASLRRGHGVGIYRAINIRWVFFAYAAGLFVATHWPRLRLPEVVHRTDLWMHLLCFGLWMVLATLAAFFGPRWSKQNIGLTAILSLAYAGVDELLQMPGFLGRSVGLDDFGANAVGVLGASVLLLMRGAMRGWQQAY